MTQSTGSSIRFIIEGQRRNIGLTMLAAFLGGVVEATFLIAVTRTAFAITDDGKTVSLGLGVDPSIGRAIALLGVLILARLVLAAAAARQSAIATSSAVASVRKRLAASYLRADWPTQQAQQAGSFQQLMSGYSSNAAGMVSGIVQTTTLSANLIALIILAFYVDHIAALAVVAIGALLALVLRPVRKALQRRAIRETKLSMAFAHSTNELSQLGLELHVFHVQDESGRRMRNSVGGLEIAARRVALVRNLLTPVYSGLAYFSLLIALGLAYSSNATNIESLGAGILVMLRSLGYAQGVQGSLASVLSNAPAVGELQEVLDELELGCRTDQGAPVADLGVIRVENVSFSYRPNILVLRNISFNLAPNEVVGIVGPSGSGKSTMVELLLGLRQPSSGTIRAAGRNIAEFSAEEWSRRATFVPQRPRMIHGTIADNIRFFRADITEADVHHAAELAHIHDEIMTFDDGYSRRLGNEGEQLSGGQEQRISIARALVERPSLLILDEPTSALDARSEAAIRRTLDSLREKMTIVIIAHRLSTLESCDKLAVIEDGELRAFAEPTWLAEHSDFFKDLVEHSTIR